MQNKFFHNEVALRADREIRFRSRKTVEIMDDKNILRQSIKKAKYVRVSTSKQSTTRQEMVEEGVKLYVDKVSGVVPFNERKSGKQLLKDINAGKINYVIVHSLDRLGRNAIETQTVVNHFIKLKIQLKVENLGLELLTPDGELNLMMKAMFDLLAVFSQQEKQMLDERRSEGIAIAKVKGKYLGRKIGSTMRSEGYEKRHATTIALLHDGNSVSKTAKLLGRSKTTVRKVKTYFDNKAIVEGLGIENISCPTTT